MTYDMILQADIDKLLNAIPAVGSRVKITYSCEYIGMASKEKDKGVSRISRVWTRRAVIVQKIHKGTRSSVTVEIQPEAEIGRQGRYKSNFSIRDLLTGIAKIKEVE
jgi:hypothetical protein